MAPRPVERALGCHHYGNRVMASGHGGNVDLASLPVLTTRRACMLADCHRSTLQRRGPRPIGKRGRTLVYATADILAWMTGGLEPSPSAGPARASAELPPRERSVCRPLDETIARLRTIAKGRKP